jgi:hypothetical protein
LSAGHRETNVCDRAFAARNIASARHDPDEGVPPPVSGAALKREKKKETRHRRPKPARAEAGSFRVSRPKNSTHPYLPKDSLRPVARQGGALTFSIIEFATNL